MIKYAKVRDQDISNGPGIRVSIFLQGCNHQCQNCFNPETWNPNGGYWWSIEKMEKVLELCGNDKISGLSLLGGDPLFYFDKSNLHNTFNRTILIDLVREFKQQYPDKSIWLWTGYTWEQCVGNDGPLITSMVSYFLEYIDVIVDGLFIEDLKVPNLKWRGSTNQRFIDVQNSLHYNKMIPFNVQ
jgi:anaerobic ribonucleoside-triphosphate reductase activating protein